MTIVGNVQNRIEVKLKYLFVELNYYNVFVCVKLIH